MGEKDNSRRNATNAGLLATVVLASSVAGGAVFAEFTRRSAQAESPLASETVLIAEQPTASSAPLDWDTRGEEPIREKGNTGLPQVAKFDEVISGIIRPEAMPNLWSTLDQLKLASPTEIADGPLDSAETLYSFSKDGRVVEAIAAESYSFSDENGPLIHMYIYKDAEGHEVPTIIFSINNEGTIIPEHLRSNEPIEVQRLAELSSKLLSIIPEGTDYLMSNAHPDAIVLKTEDQNSFNTVVMLTDGWVWVKVNDKAFIDPPKLRGLDNEE